MQAQANMDTLIQQVQMPSSSDSERSHSLHSSSEEEGLFSDSGEEELKSSKANSNSHPPPHPHPDPSPIPNEPARRATIISASRKASVADFLNAGGQHVMLEVERIEAHARSHSVMLADSDRIFEMKGSLCASMDPFMTGLPDQFALLPSDLSVTRSRLETTVVMEADEALKTVKLRRKTAGKTRIHTYTHNKMIKSRLPKEDAESSEVTEDPMRMTLQDMARAVGMDPNKHLHYDEDHYTEFAARALKLRKQMKRRQESIAKPTVQKKTIRFLEPLWREDGSDSDSDENKSHAHTHTYTGPGEHKSHKAHK